MGSDPYLAWPRCHHNEPRRIGEPGNVQHHRLRPSEHDGGRRRGDGADGQELRHRPGGWHHGGDRAFQLRLRRGRQPRSITDGQWAEDRRLRTVVIDEGKGAGGRFAGPFAFQDLLRWLSGKGCCLIEKRERIRQMAMDIHRTRTLLILLAAALVAAGLLALVQTTPAQAADRSFAPAPSSPISVGTNPTTVANADFNGDGKVDLAAQNAGSNTVSVLLGNGDGTFQSKHDFAVGLAPTSVISADFDSDGIADLAVTNQNSNNVSVLLGQDSNGDNKA